MITIRDAAPGDLPVLLDIYNQSVTGSTATFDLEPQTLEQRQAWFANYGGKFPLIVAEWEGIVAGYSCLSTFRAKPAFNPTVELSIYIDERFHRKGIGRKLMEAIIDRGRQLGYHTIIACITRGNDGSVIFHEQFGFELAGTIKEAGYKFDAWQDIFFYQLMLDN